MKRLGIYSFYDNNGIADSGDIYYLESMNKILDHVIIVVNGKVSLETEIKIRSITNDVIVRENKGFDAGGFQQVLLNLFDGKELNGYDELVLFNNTMFGPVYPLEEIFIKMEKKNIDFWGMTLNKSRNLPDHIQSYFLSFNKKVFQSECFSKFWKNLNMNFSSIDYLISEYEVVLTSFLKNNGFCYDVFLSGDGGYIYLEPYEALKNKMPLIKKKIFRSNESVRIDDEEWKKISSLLKKENSVILEHIKEYMKKYEFIPAPLERKNEPISNVQNEDILDYVQQYKRVYFYGITIRTCYLMNQLKKEKYFIESDAFFHGEYQGDIRVFKLSEVAPQDSDSVCVNFLRAHNTRIIIDRLKKRFQNIIHIHPE